MMELDNQYIAHRLNPQLFHCCTSILGKSLTLKRLCSPNCTLVLAEAEKVTAVLADYGCTFTFLVISCCYTVNQQCLLTKSSHLLHLLLSAIKFIVIMT